MILSANLRGIAAMVIAMGMFISSDAASKLVFASVPMFELMAIRAYVGTGLCLILVIVMNMARDLPKLLNPLVLARGVCEVLANFGFTLAIFYLPIADVTAIAQTAPLMVIIGANLFFGEKLGGLRLGLIVLGLAGALLVAQPGSSAASPLAALGFLVALAATCRDLITRKVPASVPAPVAALAVLSCLTIAAIIGSLATEQPTIPNLRDTGLLVLAGVLMVGGHVGVFLAYKLGEARTIAPFMYTLTVWAVLAGVIVFGEWPNLLATLGIVVILAAGLAVSLTDRRHTGAQNA